MVEEVDGIWFPEDRKVRKAWLFVERLAARYATAATFCTEGARTIFVERYGERASRKSYVIENGYDPLPFLELEQAAATMRRSANCLHLVHSGALYPGPDRDPTNFLQALATLRAAGELPEQLRVTFRASGFDERYRPLLKTLGIEDIVRLAPAIPYSDALREIVDASGLLVFQGRPSNPAIPAKIYEYLRARRPLLAMVDHDGETAALLRSIDVGTIVQSNDLDAVTNAVREFLAGVTSNEHRVLNKEQVGRFSRVERVRQFAQLFDSIVVS
jgi:hypothetical protein